MGLPPVDAATEEEVILQVLNKLDNINIKSEDIDICHPIPTKRQDGKSVHVVKFVSRKKKIDILKAKKQTRDFQHEGNTIFINEHLAPNNRRLFFKCNDEKASVKLQVSLDSQWLCLYEKS